MSKLKIGSLTVEIVRKNIKNLHLAVYPPNGRVRVAVPLRVDNEALRLAVASRIAWIRRQQKKFLTQDRQSRREFVQRESHYYLGRRYFLNVIIQDGPARVIVNSKPVIDFYIPSDANRLRRERILQEWYRKELKTLIPPLIKKWEDIIGIHVDNWGVKKMKTKWGTCNTRDRRIWINLELAKKPIHCVEYIIVHEMVHLLERKHNERFVDYMDKFLPRWRTLRDQLNRFPLRHENWDY
ncbi:MAG: SprT family zinc-dependent metalloprotease [Bacteroidota bacterium]